jgi:hypothetical protein
MFKTLLLFFATLLFIAVSIQGQSIEITTTDDYGADTYLTNDEQRDWSHPDSCHGDEETMKLRNYPGTRLKIPYLRFDISSIKTPGIKIDSAKIALWPLAYKGAAFPVLYVYALVNDDFDTWDEMTTCFNNAPGFIPYQPNALYETYDMALVDSMIVNDTLVAPGESSAWRDGIAYFHSEGSDLLDDFINNTDTNGLLTFAFLGDANNTDHDFDIATKEDTVTHYPKLIFNTVITGIDDENKAIITEYKLNQNYPNPFNPVTSIKFTLEKSGYTTLEIYNTLGQLVITLIEGQMSSGQHQISFNAEKYTSGIYFYKLTSGNFTEMKKMMFLK